MTGHEDQAAGLTPLEMARNCIGAVRRLGEFSDRDPLGAHLAGAGTRGTESARLAGNLALVSIAESLDRIVTLVQQEVKG